MDIPSRTLHQSNSRTQRSLPHNEINVTKCTDPKSLSERSHHKRLRNVEGIEKEEGQESETQSQRKNSKGRKRIKRVYPPCPPHFITIVGICMLTTSERA